MIIQNLSNKADFKKIGLTKSILEEINNLIGSKDCVEIVGSNKLFINCMKTNQDYFLYFQNEDESIFYKNVRDNFEEILKVVKNKSILSKIIRGTYETSSFIIQKIIQKKVKSDLQIKNIVKKLTDIHGLLQNVFIVNEKKDVFFKSFDTNDSVFVFSELNEENIQYMNKIKYSGILLVIDKQSVPYKKLKSIGLKNLSNSKESTKYIWFKQSK